MASTYSIASIVEINNKYLFTIYYLIFPVVHISNFKRTISLPYKQNNSQRSQTAKSSNNK